MSSARFAAVIRLTRSVPASIAVLAVLLACALPAEASIIATATKIKDPSAGAPFSSPDAALGSPWESYRLSISATGSDLIQAVDVQIHGPLHQRWASSNSDGVYDTATGNSTNAANGDSHFMATNTMLFASGPTEDNPATFAPLGGGSPLSPTNTVDTGYGVGTSMSAVFGPPGAQVTSMNIAYIVIPKRTLPNLNFSVKVFNPNGDLIATIDSSDFPLPGVFEPPVVNNLDLTNPLDCLNCTVSGQVTATNNPTSWAPALNSLVLQSYTPNYGASGGLGPIAATSWDPVTQQFSWNTTGAKGGDYVWGVSATNLGGTGNGTITVHILTPEPSSLLLAALAVLGVNCRFRCGMLSSGTGGGQPGRRWEVVACLNAVLLGKFFSDKPTLRIR